MIRVREARPTDFNAVEAQLAGVTSLPALRQYYEGIISRHERLNQKFFFAESFDRDYVVAQLDANWPIRDRDLFGIPFGVKDVFNTKVLPTAMGSAIWKDFKAGNNARVVDEISDRGGIVFSKTTTAEFAVHYIQAGKTLNPHKRDRITGTSSAGSAVAVACGAVPIALGTQTAGSIVRPASFCGIYGFKPSFGAYDRTGTLKTTDTLDTIGLLGSDVHGLKKTFLASFQQENQYPIARRYFDHARKVEATPRIRVGVIRDQFAGYRGYDEIVRDDFDRSLAVLADMDLDVSEVPSIDFINEVHHLHEQIYCKSLSYYFQVEFERGTGMSDIMAEMIRRGSLVTVEQYVAALERQPELRSQFDAVISSYDFIVTPSTASVAPMLGQQEREDTCLIWTFFGYPALSIPAFWSPDDGLPFGLQAIAPKFGDISLLGFGSQLVDAFRALTACR